MSLLDQAKADIEQITTNTDEWARTMVFTAPDSSTAQVRGTHAKHHLSVDSDGVPVNSRNAHVSVAEQEFIDAGYTIRNSEGKVSLKDHTVTVKDSTGNDVTYIIREWYPDETIGLIVCILGDFV